jgi:thiamine kinase-like enzyme
MAAPPQDPEARIAALPLWRGPVRIEPLQGGLTNRNYLVSEPGGRRAVVRSGGDIPVHGILRFNERAASHAAGAAGVSPRVLHSEPSLLVLDYIDGRTFGPQDIRANRARCVALVRQAHREIARHLRGPTLSFNVFHIARDYAHTLVEDGNRIVPRLPRLLAAGAALERAVGAVDLVFGHNDLLASNFLDDGARLWLIDWDYAGWNSPLFDLAGLSSNNSMDPAEEEALLGEYFGTPVTDALRRRLRAMACASLLRETLWSHVSESRSRIDFDYRAYSDENLRRFERAWEEFRPREIE